MTELFDRGGGREPADAARALESTERRSAVEDGPPVVQAARPPLSPQTASLLELIDRLSHLLERSELLELEVEAADTAIVLRKAAALPQPSAVAPPVTPSTAAESAPPAAPAVSAVHAPLTGIFYAAPSPGSPPYVVAGQSIAIGQVIGLIEAMKLFNEIKSDRAGRVIRLLAESGKLVKAKQPLIEVEPV